MIDGTVCVGWFYEDGNLFLKNKKSGVGVIEKFHFFDLLQNKTSTDALRCPTHIHVRTHTSLGTIKTVSQRYVPLEGIFVSFILILTLSTACKRLEGRRYILIDFLFFNFFKS